MSKFVLTVLFLMAAATQSVAQQQKPNVVFILADNVGYGDLGAYGGGELRGAPTPRLDQLAREGLRLTQFLVEPACTLRAAGQAQQHLDPLTRLHADVNRMPADEGAVQDGRTSQLECACPAGPTPNRPATSSIFRAMSSGVRMPFSNRILAKATIQRS